MSETLSQTPNAVPQRPAPQARKPYHAPRLEDYGTVNELTRSGPDTGSATFDGLTSYTSAP